MEKTFSSKKLKTKSTVTVAIESPSVIPTQIIKDQKRKDPMLKVTISGSFRTQVATDKDRYNFDGISGIMPVLPYYKETEDITALNALAERLLPLWLKQNGINDNYEGRIKIYIDAVEETTGENICIGKNIKTMNWEELQYLAIYKGLREVPLYKKGDLRSAREKAYERYEAVVNNKTVWKTAKELKTFVEEKEKLTVSGEDIAKAIKDNLSLVVDVSKIMSDERNPIISYNFARLDDIIVS